MSSPQTEFKIRGLFIVDAFNSLLLISYQNTLVKRCILFLFSDHFACSVFICDPDLEKSGHLRPQVQ
jgi:hypothetical protein